mmetsp:Transcript_5455/g.13230  ORF Transcript_5455/g.13230 Transcript_5455/m.13230 type:complete len:459 (+) Transcript_5455:3-1379(+)
MIGGRLLRVWGRSAGAGVFQNLTPPPMPIPKCLAASPLRSFASFKPNWSNLESSQKSADKLRTPPPPPGEPQDHPPVWPGAHTPPPAETPGQIVPSATNEVQTRASLEQLLAEPYLAIQRRLELANLIVGFEQANHYTLFNRHGHVVGYMAEETSVGKTITRNLLRTHRPFTATIFDPAGNILLRVSRPFYWISSSLFITSALHDPVGEVHMSWHLWRRRYTLYQDQKQFGAIDAPLLSWEFTLEDEQGRAVAAVDKNFAGLGTIIQTLFTDAHTYIVHLDPKSPLYDFSARYNYTSSVASEVTPGVTPGTTPGVTPEVTPGVTPAPQVTPGVTSGVTSSVTPSVTSGGDVTLALPPGWEKRTDPVGRPYYANPSENKSQWDPPALVPAGESQETHSALPEQAIPEAGPGSLVPAVPLGRDLTNAEKAVVLGCAISIDFDFFSRHSGGGIPMPFFFIP